MSATPAVRSISKRLQIKAAAEADLLTFIKLVHPQRVLGHVHEELIAWWGRSEAKSHQLVLLPRDHQKSAMIAYRAAWWITKNPDVRILYISATSNLATKQLKFIKDILESDIYRNYWPEMINPDISKREKWTETEISVDHPKRRAEAVRDPTIFTAGLTTSTTGFHCDVSIFDDVVVPNNAYTVDGRSKVEQQYSQLASIESTDAVQWVVGTRYDPSDLYGMMQEVVVDEYDDEGEIVHQEPLYEVFQKQVEDRGDGTGNFLWPRMARSDGKVFGFDQKILARKRAAYGVDKVQFFAQYYNNPNDASTSPINPEWFQYYNKHLVRREGRSVYYNQTRLNVFAAVDFAFSLGKKADSTSIVVIGVSPSNDIYVLDIARFKTQLISTYYERILELHQKWGFNRIRADATSAQIMIVKDLRENYIRKYGLALVVEEFKANRHMGTKEERMDATLRPRYENQQIWHSRGGNWELLEEELIQARPAHDDIKDCLASVIEIAKAPTASYLNSTPRWEGRVHSSFGGLG